MKQLIVLLLGLLLLSACTTTDEIIIDRKGVEMDQYYADLEECQKYGSEVKTAEKGTTTRLGRLRERQKKEKRKKENRLNSIKIEKI